MSVEQWGCKTAYLSENWKGHLSETQSECKTVEQKVLRMVQTMMGD